MLTHGAQRALISTLIAAAAATISLAGCGGGGGHTATAGIPAPAATTPAPGNVGTLGSTSLTITIPAPPGSSSSSAVRKPAYVSASTAKLVFTINSTSSPTLTSGQLAYANTQFGTKTLTLGNSTCPSNGNGSYTCTFTFQIPPATYNLTLSAQDGSGNVLSQETSDIAITVAQNNAANVVLVAQPATMTIATSGSTSYLIGPHTVAAGNTEMLLRLPSGTAATTQSYTVALKDHDGNSITGSGFPAMTVSASGNSDITVTNVTQASGTSTPYSFTLNASPSAATPVAATPTTIAVKFADPGSNGISTLQQSFNAINGQLFAVNGTIGSNPAIQLYGYGDGTYSQFGSTITGSTSYFVQSPDFIALDGNDDLFIGISYLVADPNDNGAVYKIPFANLGGATPAATEYTYGSAKLAPNTVGEMTVTPAGAVTLANNLDDCTVDGSANAAEAPDAMIYAAAGSTEFTFGWNNIGTFANGDCGEAQSAITSAVAVTNTASSVIGLAGVDEYNTNGVNSDNGYGAFVYFANPGGATQLNCDVPGGATTPCWEVDATSNVNSTFAAKAAWDYQNQRLVVANSVQTGTTSTVLSFPASSGVISTTSNVLGTISGGSSYPTVLPFAMSRNGYVALPYETSATNGVVNIFNDATLATVQNAFAGTALTYPDGNTTQAGFISSTSAQAFYMAGENSASQYVVEMYSTSSATPIATLNLGSFALKAVGGGTEARRRAPLALSHAPRMDVHR